MNTQEINGFEIDKFNQYDLPVGKKEGHCPLCSPDRSPKNQKAKCASYDWERGLGTCHHCSEVFQLHTFLRRANDRDYVRPKYNHTALPDKVVEWFKSRGISQQALIDFKVGYGREWMPQTGQHENAIHFNYFIGDELINVKYRDGHKNFKLVKGAEKVFYNLNSIFSSDIAVVVEGELDALALHTAGITNVISVPNGATLNSNNLDYLDNCIDYFADKEKVILALDEDEAGQALRYEFIRRLGAELCYVARFGDVKDANEYLIKYGINKLRDTINNAEPVPLEYVTTYNDIKNDVEDFVEHGFRKGYQVGLDNFDEIFSTYTGQFITVTGVPSSGKSDWVDRMAVGYNQRYGWKTAFASPENQPTFLHAHKLIRKFWGGMPRKEDVGSEKWNQITNHVNDNYFFIDMERYDLDSVLKKGAELVKRKGIKCLVIDPFNKVRMSDGRGLSTVDYTMEYLTRIDVFCKKYDVLVIIVAHPTKMQKRDDGSLDEPTMYSIKGGGEWYDSSYHGLLVHRNYQQKTVKVKVLKVKFQNLGENQAEAHFRWDFASGDYIPHMADQGSSMLMPWE